MLLIFLTINSIIMKTNIQKDPGNGGCCGGGLTDWGCC